MNAGEDIGRQRAFFRTGATRSLHYRTSALKRFRDVLVRNERNILEALGRDMGKPPFEALTSEWWVVLAEVKHAIRHLRSWSRRSRRPTSPLVVPASTFVDPVPYGVALIISPWNYPFHLSLLPLVSAVAAGNCVLIKPSEYAPASSAALSALIRESFDERHVTVVEGGREEAEALLGRPLDYIFFSGSLETGRRVMRAAAQHLTPVTLELGGKNPCIVEADADVKVASRRIAWAKFFNAGQSCVAPDYVLVDRAVKEPFLDGICAAVRSFYGTHPAESRDFGRIINHRHFDRLLHLLPAGEAVIGGEHDRDSLYIAPTVLDRVTWSDPVMREEVFGPILPVLDYADIGEAIATVEANAPRPLALYLFSGSRKVQRRVLGSLEFGNGCINDAMSQIIGPNVPFGGVGASGMGCYHGKEGFLTFSRKRGMVRKPTIVDPPLRYPPYGRLKEKLVRWLS